MKEKQKKNKGITLIALVITIIVLLILAGVTVVTLTGDNGLLTKTAESQFKSEIKQYEEELKLSIHSEEIEALGNRTNVINVPKKDTNTGNDNENYEADMKKYIPSFNNSKYGTKLEIRNDELIYTDEENEQERKWFGEVELSLAKIFITINYVDKAGNKLAEPETISTTTGRYEIEPKIIEHYEAERLLYEGKTTQDKEITITYLQESGNLAYIGLDNNGNETEDESKILAYTVSGIGNFTGEDLVIPREYNGKEVTQIKGFAFSFNDTLKKIVIPENIEIINNGAFKNSKKIQYIVLDSKIVKPQFAFYGIESLIKLEIGKNVSTINTQAFDSCSNLIDVTTYSDNAVLTAKTFSGCNKLDKIKILDNNKSFTFQDGIIYSKNYENLYMYCPGKNEEKFSIPTMVRTIKAEAFYGNSKLKEINIPNTVNTINNEAFRNCTNLVYVNINAKMILSNFAFYNNSNLKTINIGTNINSISGNAFGNCRKIEKLKYEGTVEEWNNINKSNGWNSDSNITKVKCTDGEVDV